MRLCEIEYREDSGELFARCAMEIGAVFLDSGTASGPHRRQDLLLRQPLTWIREDAGGVWRQDRGGKTQRQTGTLFSVLRRLVEKQAGGPELGNGVTVPLVCGLLAYDWAVGGNRSRDKNEDDQPVAVFALYDQALLQDHQQRRAWIISSPGAEDAWTAVLARPLPESLPFQLSPAGIRPHWSYAEYAAAYARAQEYILAGDCYQINLAQGFSASWEGDPWILYQRLRSVSRAPFSAFFRHPWGTLLSVSPERLLRLGGGRLQARPIKGTRPRHPDPRRDRERAEELLLSHKDRAENLMIVDLLRNDLGKVAALGSVQVPELFSLESYDQVHHLVSSIEADLAPGFDAWDALAAAFPGGSITGAPKRRAMEIIAELEAGARGIYCGSFGYVTAGGEMDWNILIRSLELDSKGGLRFFGGGAIVADSDCAAEYAESLDKVAMIRETLEAFLPQDATCATVAR